MRERKGLLIEDRGVSLADDAATCAPGVWNAAQVQAGLAGSIFQFSYVGETHNKHTAV